MKFDKTKVYTTFTADEVKVGSKGYFAETKEDLISRVQSEDEFYCDFLYEINCCIGDYVFVALQGSIWRYFYLVEEPKEKTKRPCTREELLEMLKKQGLPMLKSIFGNLFFTVESISDNVFINEKNYPYKSLCEQYTLLDGTELWVEE